MKLINDEYNVKLNYLVCKNLLITPLNDYDELHLRNCFFSESNFLYKYEEEIVKIKNYFSKKEAFLYKSVDICNLYNTITNENVLLNIDRIINEDITIYEKIIIIGNEIDKLKISNKILLFKICILILTCIEKNQIIIPHYNYIERIFYETINGKIIQMVKALYDTLLLKTKKYNSIHSLEENKKILLAIKDNADDFIKSNDIISFGVYGSFSTNMTNKYSDLDLFVLISDSKDSLLIKKQVKSYWGKIINIPIDVKVVKESNINTELTKCMRKTLKIIAGRKIQCLENLKQNIT